MDFLTVSSLMVALVNIFTWLENIFFAVLHWLGDFSKAVVSILPNLLSWFGTKAFTSFCWLEDIGKNLIGIFSNILSWLGTKFFIALYWFGDLTKTLIKTVNLFLGSFSDYKIIIILYSCVWLSIIFMIWFLYTLTKSHLEKIAVLQEKQYLLQEKQHEYEIKQLNHKARNRIIGTIVNKVLPFLLIP
ncbi:hypothetical protein Riv7116_1528 [Rivularia sp. PCC 7116]|uniref:hypothetical protein n=1 Tax=Rivularia sp. PCC 7116 TaxID=373994 RepID=UPI00029F4539|nr:hypothetical protein [Rivularia sp. PCC 7116]AFY54088.1 hypothetical protein Riv7116_1528 [Rivularia sp. PCC 7116]